jgi:hypothetical protein
MNVHVVRGWNSDQQVENGINFLGIRNIRDEATHNVSGPGSYEDFCAIHAATRAMTDMISITDVGACSPFNPSSTDQNIADTKIEYDTLATCGAMLYAESQNEPNNEPFWYQCNQCSIGTSFLPCAKYQRDLYQLIRNSGDSLLSGKSVVGMSEVGSEPDNVGLQYLTIPSGLGLVMPGGTVYADYANSHGYVQGNGSAGLIPMDNQARLSANIHDSKYNAGVYSGLWDIWGEYWGLTWNRLLPDPTRRTSYRRSTPKTAGTYTRLDRLLLVIWSAGC